jgi:hypothetical protein
VYKSPLEASLPHPHRPINPSIQPVHHHEVPGHNPHRSPRSPRRNRRHLHPRLRQRNLPTNNLVHIRCVVVQPLPQNPTNLQPQATPSPVPAPTTAPISSAAPKNPAPLHRAPVSAKTPPPAAAAAASSPATVLAPQISSAAFPTPLVVEPIWAPRFLPLL